MIYKKIIIVIMFYFFEKTTEALKVLINSEMFKEYKIKTNSKKPTLYQLINCHN